MSSHMVFRWYQEVDAGVPIGPPRLQVGTYYTGELGGSRTYWQTVETVEVDEKAQARKRRAELAEVERLAAEKAARPKWWQGFK
jgi:hypothetical protein